VETNCEYLPARERNAPGKRPTSAKTSAREWRSVVTLASAVVWATLIPFTRAAAQPENAAGIAPAIVEALGRDLGLTPEQVTARMAAEKLATERTHPAVREALDTAYAGAWFDATDLTLVVATSDPATVGLILANGARPVVVTRSMQELNSIHDRLNQGVLQLSDEQKQHIWTWGPDVKTNSIVITIAADDPQALIVAQDLITLSRIDADAVRIEQSTEGPPRLFAQYLLRGGDEYFNTYDSGYCSVGFSVATVPNGYVTAGHCSGGTTGDVVAGYLGAGFTQGTFVASEYPGSDRAWVQVSNGDWAGSPCVGTGDDRNGDCTNDVAVVGSEEVGVGIAVCRYGRTTGGPHCGDIEAVNQSVNFGAGIVSPMTRTNACGEPGDSGGPFVSGTQGQGTLTGGSGNCTSGGTSYFYPLNLTLAAFGLELETAAGAGAPTAPSISPAFQQRTTGASPKVQWTTPAGTTSFRLYRSVWAEQFALIYNGPATSYTHVSAPNGEYLYRVRACNATACSAMSNYAEVWICPASGCL
jgi:streptogrisin C